MNKTQTERRSYEIDELGKISATLTHLEPRVIRTGLSGDELQDFEAQLKASRRAADHPGHPRRARRFPTTTTNRRSTARRRAVRYCRRNSATPQRAASKGTAPQRLKRTQRALDCLDKTVGDLDDAVLAHYASYMAFPGRSARARRTLRLTVRQPHRSVHAAPELSSGRRSGRAGGTPSSRAPVAA